MVEKLDGKWLSWSINSPVKEIAYGCGAWAVNFGRDSGRSLDRQTEATGTRF
jgi:hypothetical protein